MGASSRKSSCGKQEQFHNAAPNCHRLARCRLCLFPNAPSVKMGASTHDLGWCKTPNPSRPSRSLNPNQRERFVAHPRIRVKGLFLGNLSLLCLPQTECHPPRTNYHRAPPRGDFCTRPAAVRYLHWPGLPPGVVGKIEICLMAMAMVTAMVMVMVAV